MRFCGSGWQPPAPPDEWYTPGAKRRKNPDERFCSPGFFLIYSSSSSRFFSAARSFSNS